MTDTAGEPWLGAPPSTRHSTVAGPRQPKLAERIARQLEDRILSEGWPVGTPLGSEAILAASAGVGRWSFREAARILEQDGLVESRRGGGGGLFVAATVGDFVRNGLSHYIEYLRATPTELIRVCTRLEAGLMADATERLQPVERDMLVRLAHEAVTMDIAAALYRVERIRSILSQAAGNPALALLTSALSRTMMHAAWTSSMSDAEYDALFPIIVSDVAELALGVARGDHVQTAERLERYIDCRRRLLNTSFLAPGHTARAGSHDRAWRLYPSVQPRKKADLMARRIRDLIMEAGWPVGWNMGTEPVLMERFGVGRSVLREAIRSLERLGVVHMGRGSCSGLTVIAPDPAQVIATCRRHLRRTGTTSENLARVQACLRGSGLPGTAPRPIERLFEAIICSKPTLP